MSEKIPSLREKTRDARNNVLNTIFNPRALAILAGATTVVSTVYGAEQILPKLDTAVSYLQTVQPDLSWIEATVRLLLSNNLSVDEAKRLMLHVGGGGVKPLETWAQIKAAGLPIPKGVNPDSYVLNAKLINEYFWERIISGVPVLLTAVSAAITLILANKIRLEGKGQKSEFSLESSQAQDRFDLFDKARVQRVEDLLRDQKKTKTFSMETTYFDKDSSTNVLNELFIGDDGKQKKEAIESIGLRVDDEILKDDFRLVTKAGIPSIVLRVKRDGKAFGKETWYAHKGYPPLLDIAYSRLVGHTDVTTLKERTELRRTVRYFNPISKKEETTVAILNYDRYFDSQRPKEILYRRIEIVMPDRVGVKPEEVFLEFFESGILGGLQISLLNDRDIGHKIAQGETIE